METHSHPPRSVAPRSGFTLIEILIVVALIAVIGTISFFSLYGRMNETNLASARIQIVATLREAQSRSVSDDQGVAWGVHFANPTSTAPFYALFYSSYASTTTAAYYRLPPSIAYITSTLPRGSSTDILFSQLSGTTSASTSISIWNTSEKALSSTISISNSGLVGF